MSPKITPALANTAQNFASQILHHRPTLLPRRELLLGGGTLGAGLVLGCRATATSATTVDVTTLGADPTQTNDCTPAFRAALALLGAAGGTIYVPAGHYLMNSPFDVGTTETPSQIPVTIKGDGNGESLLVFNHSSTGISMVSNGQKMAVHDLGLVSLALTKCGIAITMPALQVAASPSCTLENLDFGAQVPGVTGFIGCLSLTNIWKSTIRNVTTNGTVIPGSYLVKLGGRSIDNYFFQCQAQGVDTAFIVTDYSEGIRLESPVIAGCNTGMTTGTTAFVPGRPQNVLGLYIGNAEIACFNVALDLYQVWSGWISNTHMGSNNNTGASSMSTVRYNGCFNIQMEECQITGNYNNSSSSQNCVGITMVGVPTAGSGQNQVDNCVFTNIGTSLVYGAGSGWNNANRLKQINGPTFPSLAQTGVAVDLTGPNTSNQAEWDTGLPGAARYKYMR